jgi:hypothetical protein
MNFDFLSVGKDLLKGIIKTLNAKGLLASAIATAMSVIHEEINTDAERDKIAREVNGYIDIPLLGERQEYNIFKGILEYAANKTAPKMESPKTPQLEFPKVEKEPMPDGL